MEYIFTEINPYTVCKATMGSNENIGYAFPYFWKFFKVLLE